MSQKKTKPMSHYFDQITSRIPELLTRYRVPGVAFGLFYQGHKEAAGFGISAIENGLTAQFTNRVTPMPRQCCFT